MKDLNYVTSKLFLLLSILILVSGFQNCSVLDFHHPTPSPGQDNGSSHLGGATGGADGMVFGHYDLCNGVANSLVSTITINMVQQTAYLLYSNCSENQGFTAPTSNIYTQLQITTDSTMSAVQQVSYDNEIFYPM